MNRWQAAGALVLVWAVIYLPALGTTEIKGEEGRRILPAVSMLEDGYWIVPRLSGEPYLRKPPLINWAIAGAFKITGSRSEWAARLPSVLSVLALGLITLFACDRWLRTEGALLAALFMITNIGLIEKGRLAEIEALYISLTGAAIAVWLGSWVRGGNPWARWILAWLFLGLGLLTKGPLHLLYFYAVVGAVLWCSRERRELFRWSHLIGILVGLIPVILWLVPYLAATESGEAASTWRDQFANRIFENKFDLKSWLLSVPRGLANFLPWVILVPLLWRRDAALRLVEREESILRGGRLAVALCFALLLVPGFLVRYSMPLIVPASLLLALVLRDAAPAGLILGWRRGLMLLAAIVALGGIATPFVAHFTAASIAVACGVVVIAAILARRREMLRTPLQLGFASVVGMGALVLIYAVAVVPRMVLADNVRPMAAAIDAAVPEGATLYAYKVDYQLELFYLRSQVEHFRDWDDLPRSARYLLARSKSLKDVRKEFPSAAVEEILGRGPDQKPLLIIRLEDRS